jgi:hypothetical protein
VSADDDNESVLYEVNLEADAAIEAAFDTWLRDHIADLLQFKGFLSAEILGDDSQPPGKVRRIVQYRLRDQAALDDYVRDHAPRMRAQGIEKFGDRFSTERRVLAHREEFIRGAVSTENCLNCGEVLRGQHCAHCGQRARVRVLSLGSLLRDVFGDITNFDSRLWRTLKPLAFKPGYLTAEFLKGRRVHYTPPFRMYLMVSVAFFLAASFAADPGGDFKFDVDSADGGSNLRISEGPPKEAQAPAGKPAAVNATPKLDAERQKVVDAIVAKLPEKERQRAKAEIEQDFSRMKREEVATVQRVMNDPCSPDNLNVQIGPLDAKYGTKLRDACHKIVKDSKGYGRALFENIPKMMFIFLPLIAAVMYVLYLGSGRYYVEHLLFFVHYHAFFFLGGLAMVLFERLSTLLAGTTAGGRLKGIEGFVMAAFALYVPYYLYRAMRRVYGQGRIVTLVKYSLLGIGYVFFMTLTVLGLLFYTALTL